MPHLPQARRARPGKYAEASLQSDLTRSGVGRGLDAGLADHGSVRRHGHPRVEKAPGPGPGAMSAARGRAPAGPRRRWHGDARGCRMRVRARALWQPVESQA